MSGAADRSSGGDTLRDNLHDLRNLLAAIVSGAHLLADPLQAKRRQTVLEAIDAAGRRSSSILSALLSGAAKMASDMCDPAAQVSGLAPILTALAGGRVEVTLKLQAGGSTIACAGDRFDRIVVELVTNARRAIGECGRIELRVRHGRGHAWIIVADNGTGMGSRRLARLVAGRECRSSCRPRQWSRPGSDICESGWRGPAGAVAAGPGYCGCDDPPASRRNHRN